jgi:peptidoglycan/LPS O-acetylase OafA/YrhL
MGRTIELHDISKYRKPLMGIAMLFIMLLHVPLDRTYLLQPIKDMGNIGVDIFLFLSGIGLWFSWSKNPSLKQFYHRRFWRIYPEYFIMACLLYIPDMLRPTSRYCDNLFEMTNNILFQYGFWTEGQRAFWFIAGLMVLYLVAPFYMKLIKNHPPYRWIPVILIMVSMYLTYNLTYRLDFDRIEMFVNRIPIFLIGINCGSFVKEEKKLDSQTLWLILSIFLTCFSICLSFNCSKHLFAPIYTQRFVYIPFAITFTILLCLLIKSMPAKLLQPFSFIGGISLECYLIHSHFVLVYVADYHWGYWLTVLAYIPVTLALAWLLHRFCHLDIWTKFRFQKIDNRN